MIIIIAAISENGVIGKDGDLPWKLKDDMKHFQDTTRGHSVVMGRKTWESIPERFRPLPDRDNYVLTRQEGYSAPGATVFHSFDQVHEIDKGGVAIFVIGGKSLYEEALPRAGLLIITRVHAHVDGDVYFPVGFERDWRVEERERHEADERNEHAFTITRYKRR